MQGRTAGGARKPGGDGGSHASGTTYTKGEGEQMGVSRKWWGPAHLLHPLSVWQSRVKPVVRRRGRGSGAGRRGIEVVVVVATATATAKGRPACGRGEVGWVLACHGECNGPVSRGSVLHR